MNATIHRTEPPGSWHSHDGGPHPCHTTQSLVVSAAIMSVSTSGKCVREVTGSCVSNLHPSPISLHQPENSSETLFWKINRIVFHTPEDYSVLQQDYPILYKGIALTLCSAFIDWSLKRGHETLLGLAFLCANVSTTARRSRLRAWLFSIQSRWWHGKEYDVLLPRIVGAVGWCGTPVLETSLGLAWRVRVLSLSYAQLGV